MIAGVPREEKARWLSGLMNNRLARMVALTAILFLILIFGQIGLGQIVARLPVSSRTPIVLLGAFLMILAFLLVYRFFVRWVENRAVHELAPSGAATGLLGGVVIGAALIALVIAILWAMGAATVQKDTHATPPFISLAAAAIAAVSEELIFRGAIYRHVEECFGTFVALLVSALIFGAVHGANPNATLLSSCAIALEAGLLLALSYAATKTLWLPIGLHFGWNFTESGVFGSAVSGMSFNGIFYTTTSGPALLTGGAFGPEASIVAVVVCLAAAGVFAIVTVRRGLWRSLAVQISDRRNDLAQTRSARPHGD